MKLKRIFRLKFDRGLTDYYIPKLRAILFSERTNKKFDFIGDRITWRFYVNTFGLVSTVFGVWYIWGMIPRNHNKDILDSYRNRAKASSIYSRKPKVCGCFSSRVRTASSSKINQMSNFLCVVNTGRSILYSSSLLKTEKISINLIPICNFHRKQNNISEEKLLQKQKKDKKKSQDDDYKKDSTFSQVFWTLSYASAFTITAFTLVDFWKTMLLFVEALWSSVLEQSQMRFVTPQQLAQSLVIFTNAFVYGLWWLPSLETTLTQLATTSKDSRFISMLLASFSHRNFLHIFINMYVFTSFSVGWEQYASSHRFGMSKDYMSAERFLAFFLSAGVISSAGSRIFQTVAMHSYKSLGASGAILGLIGYICSKLPDSQLSIAFLPQFTFSAKSGMIGMAVFDAAGLLVGAFTNWRYMFLDHSAHLSGLLFGIWYAKHGEQMLYRWSKYIQKLVYELSRKR